MKFEGFLQLFSSHILRFLTSYSLKKHHNTKKYDKISHQELDFFGNQAQTVRLLLDWRFQPCRFLWMEALIAQNIQQPTTKEQTEWI